LKILGLFDLKTAPSKELGTFATISKYLASVLTAKDIDAALLLSSNIFLYVEKNRYRAPLAVPSFFF
jgi:hypothetical protein